MMCSGHVSYSIRLEGFIYYMKEFISAVDAVFIMTELARSREGLASRISRSGCPVASDLHQYGCP